MSELAIVTFSVLYKVLKCGVEFKKQHYIKKALPLCPAPLPCLSAAVGWMSLVRCCRNSPTLLSLCCENQTPPLLGSPEGHPLRLAYKHPSFLSISWSVLLHLSNLLWSLGHLHTRIFNQLSGRGWPRWSCSNTPPPRCLHEEQGQ